MSLTHARHCLIPALALCLASGARGQCEVDRLSGLESGPPRGGFGHALSLSGDTAFVGWLFDDNPGNGRGSVTVFERDPAGWGRTQRLYPNASGINGEFGMCSVKGDRALVSTFSKGLNKGQAYFYDRKPNGWKKVEVYSTGPLKNDEWGYSVAIDGDLALAGWPKDDDACPADPDCMSGSAYIFGRGPGGWVKRGKLTASDAAPLHGFGVSVALEGKRALVGSPGAYFAPGWNGGAYVFELQAGGWVETAKLVPNEPTANTWYGLSLDLSGDRVVVGAFDQDGGRGAAYVFEKTGGGWVQTAKLQASDGSPGAEFGSDVDIDGDRILVGANGEDEAGNAAGAGYLFQHSANGWQQVAKLVGESTQQNDWLGWAVALEGETALVSAPVVLWKDKLRFGHVQAFSIPEGARPYCFGVACPGGSDDSVRGCVNSTGKGALLAACGSTQVSLDDLVLTASNLPRNVPALLIMGDAQGQTTLGDGLLCVGSGGLGVFRFLVQDSGTQGSISAGPGIVAESHALFGPPGHIAAGQTWNFQLFYRDFGGSTGSNTTNAVAITFEP